jgi:hypothetical protein
MTNCMVMALAALGLAALLYNGQAMAGEKCEVTAGANKGKTGTFTEGGTWCEGSWGGTECTDQQGNSKCKAAAVVVVDDGGTVIDGNDGVVIITTGFYRTPDRGLVRCTTSTGARTSAVCFPTAVDKLEELKNSKDETNRSIAEAVNTAIRRLPAVKD